MDTLWLNGKAPEFSTAQNAWKSLTKLFLLWKTILLAIAYASPGPGYDTSTSLLFDGSFGNSQLGEASERFISRLMRWDGIYFSALAARGHVHEQEWAFSWVLAKFTSVVATVFHHPPFIPPFLDAIPANALTGILISHVSHLLAVLTLYRLSFNLIPSNTSKKHQIAFITACLHILSPAGLFLSAPFGESTFALFNFLGAACYTSSVQLRLSSDSDDMDESYYTIAAGACSAIAVMMRGNGILSGIPFAGDALVLISHPTQLLHDRKTMTRLATTMIAGMLVFLGFVGPQIVAYVEYCTNGNTRPWCTRLIPSIYGWVQDHYWEVGFMRYWTWSNLPLFLLAAPMLGIMIYTAIVALRMEFDINEDNLSKEGAELMVFKHLMPRLVSPQLILALMAVTSFHVQIINRISSGYPAWYIILAMALCNPDGKLPSPRGAAEAPVSEIINRGNNVKEKGVEQAAAQSAEFGSTTTETKHIPGALQGVSLNEKHLQWIVRGMVMYAIIQGGLYASFLPPA